MNNIFERSIGLLGEIHFANLQSKTVLIAGIGGVGGTVFEALLRTGVTSFIIIDKDDVDVTNINRQILFTNNDIGLKKVDVAKKRALSINPEVTIKSLDLNITLDTITKLECLDFDFIVDCIDDIDGKIALTKLSFAKNIPIICSMGMANKTDPTQIKVSSLNKSSVDPLAKKFRYELKMENIDISRVKCVYSLETPKKEGAKLNSIMSVTSTAGLLLANYVIYYFKEIE